MAGDKLFPFVTTDVALFTLDGDALRVLVVKRTNEPERGRWALPGGALKPSLDEDLAASARRVLAAKVRFDLPYPEQIARSAAGIATAAAGRSACWPTRFRRPDRRGGRPQDRGDQWVDGPAGPGLAFDHDQQLVSARHSAQDRARRAALAPAARPLHADRVAAGAKRCGRRWTERVPAAAQAQGRQGVRRFPASSPKARTDRRGTTGPGFRF